jgi:hypothetical protein
VLPSLLSLSLSLCVCVCLSCLFYCCLPLPGPTTVHGSGGTGAATVPAGTAPPTDGTDDTGGSSVADDVCCCATAAAAAAAAAAEVGGVGAGIICNGTDGTWTGIIAPGGILLGTWT